jgi:O-antigen/teichoic acid export membrane protein
MFSILSHPGFKRYFGNTSWLMLDKVLRLGTNLFVGLWVARYLGPDQFGILSYAVSVVALVAALSTFGLQGIVVKEMLRSPNSLQRVFASVFTIKLILGSLAISIIYLGARLDNEIDSNELLVLILASGMVFQCFDVVEHYFQSQIQGKFTAVVAMTSLLISSGAKVALICWGGEVYHFAVVILLEQVMLLIGYVVVFILKSTHGVGIFFKASLQEIRNLLSLSWPLALSSIMVTVYLKIDQVMIHQMLSERDTGLYSAAVKVSELLNFIPVTVAASLFPAILNAKKRNEQVYLNRIQGLMDLFATFAVLLTFLLIIFSSVVMVGFFGEDYRDSVPLLQWHVGSTLFVYLGVVGGKWYLSENYQKIAMCWTVIGAVINILLNLILIPKFGTIGAAVSTLVSYSLVGYWLDMTLRRTRVIFKMKTSAILGGIFLRRFKVS